MTNKGSHRARPLHADKDVHDIIDALLEAMPPARNAERIQKAAPKKKKRKKAKP